jgi:hypothetical protein
MLNRMNLSIATRMLPSSRVAFAQVRADVTAILMTKQVVKATGYAGHDRACVTGTQFKRSMCSIKPVPGACSK